MRGLFTALVDRHAVPSSPLLGREAARGSLDPRPTRLFPLIAAAHRSHLKNEGWRHRAAAL